MILKKLKKRRQPFIWAMFGLNGLVIQKPTREYCIFEKKKKN